eukprot:scaffold650_cov407-Prasinococcus_capsulatus_cf.AAC.18
MGPGRRLLCAQGPRRRPFGRRTMLVATWLDCSCPRVAAERWGEIVTRGARACAPDYKAAMHYPSVN